MVDRSDSSATKWYVTQPGVAKMPPRAASSSIGTGPGIPEPDQRQYAESLVAASREERQGVTNAGPGAPVMLNGVRPE